MRLYTVHMPSGGPPPGEPPELVKEGFCWPAFFFSVFWALYHRLWLAAVLIVLATLALGMALAVSGAGETVDFAAHLGLAIFIGTAANDWRRSKLAKRGWRLTGVVAASNGDEACRRWGEAHAVALP